MCLVESLGTHYNSTYGAFYSLVTIHLILTVL